MMSVISPSSVVRRASSVLVVVAVLAGISACGALGGPTVPTRPPSPDDASEVPQTEALTAVARLVVAVPSGALVLDANTLETIDRLATTEQPTLTLASDDRHVLLNQTGAGRTDVLDAGAWTETDGAAVHHRTGVPRLLRSAITGGKPVHVVSSAGRTAVFHDDDGAATVVTDADLAAGHLDGDVVDAESPQHGVVIPFGDLTVVSELGSASGRSPLPSSLRVLDADGREVARYDDACPLLHGEAVAGAAVVLGCSNGLAILDAAGVQHLPYPEGAGDERVGALVAAPGSPVVLGDLGPTSLALVDVAARTVTAVEVGTPYGPRARTADGGHLVLATNGTLHAYAPDGAPSGTVTVTAPYTIAEGHGALAPSLAVVGTTAYVTDPAASVVVPVDLDRLTTGTPVALDEVPSQIVATNAHGVG
jgi:hypothetical protein